MSGQQTVPIATNAVFADISDGDFRTYSIICQLAWATSPDAEKPYVELSHAQLAELHSGVKKPAANTIRVRIQRLVTAGLLKRERVNNVRWRTRPIITLGGESRPQTEHENHTQSIHLGDRPAICQQQKVEMGDRSEICQSEVGDLCEITHPHRDQLGDLPAITHSGDNSMGDQSAITQNTETESWVIAQRSVTAQNGEMGDRPTRGHPLDTDLIDFYQDQEQLKTKTDQINQVDQALAAQLASLRPEAMSSKGIEECLLQPELTAAWLAYVTDPANGVRKPAAYLRRQVRSGCFPHRLNSHSLCLSQTMENEMLTQDTTSLTLALQPAWQWPRNKLLAGRWMSANCVACQELDDIDSLCRWCNNQIHLRPHAGGIESWQRYAESDLVSLDWTRFSAEQVTAIQGYAEHVSDHVDAGWGLILSGNNGCGKTHVAVGLGVVALGIGAEAYATTLGELLLSVRNSWQPQTDQSEAKLMQRVCTTDLLILDDLGMEKPTDWARDRLAYIINHRYAANRATIVTTNLQMEALEERWSARVMSRLYGTAQAIGLHDVPDYRRSQRITQMTKNSTINQLQTEEQCS